MEQINWEVAVDRVSNLGEGPVWDSRNKCLFWVDITACLICQFFPGTGKVNTFRLESMIGAIALRESGGIVAASQNGFSFVNLDSGASTFLSNPEGNRLNNRFNDGKCDPLGRFWAGTMSMTGESRAGSLYRLNDDHSVNVMLTDVSCSNGLAWSNDHKVFYFIDTPTREVVAFDYDIATGSITNKRNIFTFAKENGVPDGMTIDAAGMLWVALWNGWKVVRIDPGTRQIISNIYLPVSRITSCTFGGDNLEDLYITSARSGLTEEELKKQPLSGSLFVVRNSGFKGVAGFYYKG